MPDCIPNIYGFPDIFFFLICLSLLFPNINPYPLAARLCRSSWLQRCVKCKTCVGLSSFYPACLFLDSCRLIWSLGAQKREKSPRVTARSWARNVLEAGEEEKIDQTKRKEKTCRYTWNKVCFHLHEEQGPRYSPSCGWTWKMLHQEDRGEDTPWDKVSCLVHLPQSQLISPSCSMSFPWVAKYEAENSSLHKTHARTTQNNTGLWFLLAWLWPHSSFCHTAERWWWKFLSTWSQEAAEESPNLGPNPRNGLATWSRICHGVTLGFHKHTFKQTNN